MTGRPAYKRRPRPTVDVCAGDVMLKALIHVQYEAGTRPGELLNLKIKHVKVDEYGAIISVDGKTNARPVRLIESVPDLVAWINAHPLKENYDAPLWIMKNKKQFGNALPVVGMSVFFIWRKRK